MNVINCPVCARPMSPSDRFCTSCGHASPTESPKRVEATPDEDAEPYNIARVESPRPASTIPNRYRVLFIVSIIFRVMAWLGAIGLLVTAIGFTSTVERLATHAGAGAFLVAGLLSAVVWWLCYYAMAELIVLLIDLESHARSVRLMMEQGRVSARRGMLETNE